MKLTTCWLAFQHHHAPTVLSTASDKFSSLPVHCPHRAAVSAPLGAGQSEHALQFTAGNSCLHCANSQSAIMHIILFTPESEWAHGTSLWPWPQNSGLKELQAWFLVQFSGLPAHVAGLMGRTGDPHDQACTLPLDLCHPIPEGSRCPKCSWSWT